MARSARVHCWDKRCRGDARPGVTAGGGWSLSPRCGGLLSLSYSPSFGAPPASSQPQLGPCCAVLVFSRRALAQRAPRRQLRACAAETSGVTYAALPRCDARCLYWQLYPVRAPPRAQVRLHRRPSWRRRQPHFLRTCGLTNEPPDCALRGFPPDASPSVPTWYWPRSRSIAFTKACEGVGRRQAAPNRVHKRATATSNDGSGSVSPTLM